MPSELGSSSFFLIPFDQGGPSSGFVSNSEHDGEDRSFDCESFYAASDFLVFKSPGNADPFEGFFLKPLDSEKEVAYTCNSK